MDSVQRCARVVQTWVTLQFRLRGRGYRERDVRFKVQDLDAAQPAPHPGRFTCDDSLNRMINEWR